MIAQEIWEQAEEHAGYCSLFGNPRRILILWLLQDQERSVSSIAAELGVSLQNTSYNLRLMKDKGVLQTRREGQTVYYRLAENDLIRSCGLLNPDSWAAPNDMGDENLKRLSPNLKGVLDVIRNY